MAFLYIDRLKNDFQTTDRIAPRAYARENWWPWFLLKLFHDPEQEQYRGSKERQVQSISVNFVPKTPKITTIGLKLDDEFTSNDGQQLLKIPDIKNCLKQYFNVVRRYQSFLHISWKPTFGESNDQENSLSFTSFTSMISKCLQKIKDKNTVPKTAERITVRCKDEQTSCTEVPEIEFLLKNASRSTRSTQERNTEDAPYYRDSLITSTITTIEINESRRLVYSPSEYRRKSTRNASVQTLDSNNSQSTQSRGSIDKGTKECSTSKDIETIFKISHTTFNETSSKTNLKRANARHTRQKGKGIEQNCHDSTHLKAKENCSYLGNISKPANKKPKSSRGVKLQIRKNPQSSKQASSRGERCKNNELTLLHQQHNDKVKSKSLVLFREDKHDHCKHKAYSTDEICNDAHSFDILSDSQLCFGENHLGGGGEIIQSTMNSPEITDISWEQRGFPMDDKASEIMILGNVKKRLEQDFDNYFPAYEHDSENDIFLNAEDSSEFFDAGQSFVSVPADRNQSQDKLKTSRVPITTTSLMRQKMKQFPRNSTEDVSHKRATRSSSAHTSSLCLSSVDASRSQSSYHTSFREQQCNSSSSSLKYRTANSNVSLTRAASSNNNFIRNMLNSYTAENGGSFDRDLTFGNCLSNDASIDESETFEDAREFLDQTLINSYAAHRFQRNSTPKCDDSARRNTESLDSGILIDCSREHVRLAPNNRLLAEHWREIGQPKKPDDRAPEDLTPTYDFDSDSSYSDESLNRRVDVVVEKFTEKLILTERRARIKLKRLEEPVRHRRRKRRKNSRQVKKVTEHIRKRNSVGELESSVWLNDDEWILSSSTPPLYSFSDSEIDHL